MKKIDKSKLVSDDAFSNSQMTLFQTFLSNNKNNDSFSNAIDFWDSTPRFSISRQRQEKLRLIGGFLPIASIEFHYRGGTYTANIRPARLELKNEEGKPSGETIEYYPSAREEIIELALRKITAVQNSGYFDKSSFRSGCRFTLYQLRQELKEKGHSLRYDELMEGLKILSLSRIEIVGEGKELSNFCAISSYLPSLITVTRQEFDTDAKAKCWVQFHPLVTNSIQQLSYRQFNYCRLMNCRTQLARWLLNNLVMKYTQASFATSFDIRYSTIKRDSALLDGYKVQRQAIAVLDKTWKEIKSLKLLMVIEKIEQRGKNKKLEDIIYTLYPSPDFVAEQKASNRRQNDAKASQATMIK